jgi:hypothetical protein
MDARWVGSPHGDSGFARDRVRAFQPAVYLVCHWDFAVLYMSGYTSDVIVYQGILEAGISLIEKPFSEAALMRKVREVLDAKLGPSTLQRSERRVS